MEIFDKIILKENMIKEEQERYVVESKTFFKGLFLIFLPLVPLIYYFLNRKNKNPNIRNFARAVKNVNLIYSILFLIIGLSFFLFFNKPMTSTLKKNNVKVERLENKTNKSKDNHTKKVVKEKKKNKKINKKKGKNNVTKKEKNKSSRKYKDTKAKKNRKEKKDERDFYVSKKGKFHISLDGNRTTFPFYPAYVGDKGFNLVATNPDPQNTANAVATWTDIGGSTLYLYYPLGQDTTITKATMSFLDNSSEFLGVTNFTEDKDMDALFPQGEVDNSNLADGNGTKVYKYKGVNVTISIVNHFATSVSIEKV